MSRIFRFNQTFYIRIPLLVTFTILPIISVLILKHAGNFESSILGFDFLMSRSEKQILWFLIGFLSFITSQYIRIRFFNEKIYILYFLTIILLILPFFGDAIKGAQNWIFGFQPSEFGKIIIVMALSKYLSDNKSKINNLKTIFISFLIIILPALIFLNQKDIGTALVYFSIFLPMLYWVGLKSEYCFIIFSPIAAGFISILFNVYDLYNKDITIPMITLGFWLIVNFIFLSITLRKKINSVLIITLILATNIFSTLSCDILWEYLDKSNLNHVKTRIENFVVPSLNPQAGGYQVAQSKIAVGSGGIFGLGLGEVNQVELQYVPEADTDFIVSSIGESLGFIFIFLIILTYLNMFYWLLDYASKARNLFQSLMIVGYCSMLFFNCIIALGMVVGIAPVTGLPAPLLSYGGTFTLSCFIMFGLCNNISNNNNL